MYLNTSCVDSQRTDVVAALLTALWTEYSNAFEAVLCKLE